jgi:hypothetical protein
MSNPPRTPKRGAWPTPKDVLDKAPRYVPKDDEHSDVGNPPQEDAPPQGDARQPKDKEKDSKQK